MLGDDPRKVRRTLVVDRMRVVMQVLFLGALLSAIKSCASATLLAPRVTFTENIWRQFRPAYISDLENLRIMRISVFVFAVCVLVYSIKMEGTPIFELVSGAYQVPLVGAFVPLVFGLYWQRATTQGALCSTVLGIGVWLAFINVPGWGEVFPQQLAGVLAAVVGMVAGSLVPQWLRHAPGQHHAVVGVEQA